MKVFWVYLLWDKDGRIVNQFVRASFRTKRVAERSALRMFGEAGWKIVEVPLYG